MNLGAKTSLASLSNMFFIKNPHNAPNFIYFNQTIIFCINTVALDLINQYSTGLFVTLLTEKNNCVITTLYHSGDRMPKLKMHQS